jgi:hypothetical protein
MLKANQFFSQTTAIRHIDTENWNFFDFFKQDSAIAIQQETDKMK